jgi:serine/threonine protein kinase
VLVDDEGHAVLCDFGVSKVMQEQSSGNTTSGGGQHTRGFAAPEILMDPKAYSKETDTYAFGSLIVEVFHLPPLAPHRSAY